MIRGTYYNRLDKCGKKRKRSRCNGRLIAGERVEIRKDGIYIEDVWTEDPLVAQYFGYNKKRIR